MNYSIRWDINSITVDSPAEVTAFVDEQTQMFNNWGTRGMTLWLGPEGAKKRDMPLRIDLDPDTDAAAIRWLPDDLVGVDPNRWRTDPIHVAESSDRELVSIPAEIVRGNIETAKRVAANYVLTGQRPTVIDWKHVT